MAFKSFDIHELKTYLETFSTFSRWEKWFKEKGKSNTSCKVHNTIFCSRVLKLLLFVKIDTILLFSPALISFIVSMIFIRQSSKYLFRMHICSTFQRRRGTFKTFSGTNQRLSRQNEITYSQKMKNIEGTSWV